MSLSVTMQGENPPKTPPMDDKLKRRRDAKTRLWQSKKDCHMLNGGTHVHANSPFT